MSFLDEMLDADKILAWVKSSDFFTNKLFKLATLLLVAIGIWIGCAVFFLQPQLSMLHKMMAEEEVLKKQFLVQKKDLQTFSSYAVALQKLQDVYHTNISLLRQPVALDSVLRDINKIGVDNHLVFDYFKPNDIVQKPFYTEFPMSVAVSGKYAHFVHFCQELSQLPRLVSVDSVEIVRKNVEEDMLKISFIINVFRFHEEIKPI